MIGKFTLHGFSVSPCLIRNYITYPYSCKRNWRARERERVCVYVYDRRQIKITAHVSQKKMNAEDDAVGELREDRTNSEGHSGGKEEAEVWIATVNN